MYPRGSLKTLENCKKVSSVNQTHKGWRNTADPRSERESRRPTGKLTRHSLKKESSMFAGGKLTSLY